MKTLISIHNTIFSLLERIGDWVMPLLARFIFAATLLIYFWNSATTKLGSGIFGFLRPSAGAYAQIFPKQMEAVSYDVSQLGVFQWLVVVLGTWAEFILPLLIVLGLATRLASLGMIGFIGVLTLTDIYGHGADAQTIGSWFDAASTGLVLDQRTYWVFLLIYLITKGGGAISIDGLLRRRMDPGPI